MSARVGDEVRAARAELTQQLDAIAPGGPLARLEEALTHTSFANESQLPDNQRLEFLGDAVLGLCTSELLAEKHASADEGTLSRMRAALVNAEALARWGRAMNVAACLAMGKGARAAGEHEQTNVVADAVEAIVAATYLGRGLHAARALVLEIVKEPLESGEVLSTRDPKSLLQERVQARGLSVPVYRAVETTGPPHEPRFVVEVVVGGEVIGRGEGRSKRQAEREAAARALEKE